MEDPSSGFEKTEKEENRRQEEQRAQYIEVTRQPVDCFNMTGEYRENEGAEKCQLLVKHLSRYGIPKDSIDDMKHEDGSMVI